ncbi:hypothetical protein QBC35DRAFT_147519 [Podospora australis]|uniref:Uncharacterized protein n=1 Tax=Podospora australis TaxID=1536484 RepID=A0AAN6WJY8_9PEZI|nr:hypothetical protein QBC35DRAFT_147519 [Podospora australis]
MAATMSYLAGAHDAYMSESHQLSRKLSHKRSKAERKSYHRYKKLFDSCPLHAKGFHRDNQQALGLPRSYSLRVVDDPYLPADLKAAHSTAATQIQGKSVIVGQHGCKDTGLNLGGVGIDVDHVTWIAPTESYTFSTLETTSTPVDVVGHLSFASSSPTGSIAIGAAVVNVELDKKTTWYDVQVSADAGAYWDTSGKKLAWDDTTSRWGAANWEAGKFTFGYDVENAGDELQPYVVAENYFRDNSSNPPTEFNLTKDTYSFDYTCIIGESTQKGALLETTVTTIIPDAPTERSGSAIKTVFPERWSIQLTPWADSFVGAYKDPSGTVYAVKGQLLLDDDMTFQESALMAPDAELEEISESTAALEMDDATGEAKEDSEASDLQLSSAPTLVAMQTWARVAPRMAAFADAPPPPSLRVQELINFNPMVPDKDDASGYRDSVAQLAMKDFQDIIVYHMDNDLRETFISTSPIALTPAVLAVATDHPDNAAFYKTMQVPLIVSILAQGTSEPGKHCNAARANARLKTIPANSEVYKRHSSKLYQLRFKERFPMQKFLDDQRQNPRTERLDLYSKKMKDYFVAKTNGLREGNPDFNAQLKTALDDIDNLVTWAKDKGIYWGVELLYFVQNSIMKQWYAQYHSGKTNSSTGMFLKQLNALFGMLEDNAVNTKPGGRNFMQAFNDEVRLYQMTTLVPQLVDINDNRSDFDSLFVECLAEYIQHYQGVDAKEHKEAMEAALLIHGNKELRHKIFDTLNLATRLSSASGSWLGIAQAWEAQWAANPVISKMASAAKFFKVTAGVTCMVMILIPLCPWFGLGEHVRNAMTPEQKLMWKMSLAGMIGLAVVKLFQNLARVYYFWADLANSWQVLKVIFGSTTVIDAVKDGALKVQNNFARWFTRTSAQTTELAGAEAAQFGRMSKIFGRNLGEAMAGVIGLVLGIVSIVLIAIDMDTKKDGLLQAMDIIMLISAGLQVLAVVAGWITLAWTSGATAVGVLGATYSALSICAAWAGPAAIVFAVIGIIIFVIWWNLTDHRDPATKFVEDKARPVGLYVENPKQAPEYIATVPADKISSSLPGVTFEGPLVPGATLERSKAPSLISAKFLRLASDEGAADLADAADFTHDTIWSFETDADGNSLIYTTRTKANPEAPEVKISTLWYVGTRGRDVIVQRMPSSRDDPKWKESVNAVKWQVTLLEVPETKGEGKEAPVLSAKARIQQGGLDLGRSVSPDGKETGLMLVDVEAFRKKAKDWNALMRMTVPPRGLEPPAPVPFHVWKISMQVLAPGGFAYRHSDWEITDQSTNERNYPRFETEVSEGLKWSISPALNGDFFELVTEGRDAGVVRQKEGVKAPATEPVSYTVTCQAMRNDQAVGPERTASFTLKVIHLG